MEADKDRDGKISFEEFTKMVENTDVSMSMTLGKPSVYLPSSIMFSSRCVLRKRPCCSHIPSARINMVGRALTALTIKLSRSILIDITLSNVFISTILKKNSASATAAGQGWLLVLCTYSIEHFLYE